MTFFYICIYILRYVSSCTILRRVLTQELQHHDCEYYCTICLH